MAGAKFRGGECLGTFATLVHPHDAIPPFITALTGITDDMVRDAPSVPGVLPAFVEFVHGTVLVGHNVEFDLAFINAALEQNDRPPLDNLVVDTLALARRLVRPRGSRLPSGHAGRRTGAGRTDRPIAPSTT